MQWYYAVNGQQQGPVEQDELAALARDGKLKPGDLVWNATMGSQWAKAASVPGLFAVSDATPSGVPPSVAEWSPDAKFKSQTHNRDLMAAARFALTGQWGLAVGGVLIYFLVTIVMSIIPYLGGLINFIIGGALMVGWYLFFLTLSRRQAASVGLIFDGFKIFGNAFLANLLIGLLILAWMLPAIVVGIAAAVVAFKSFHHDGAAAFLGMWILLVPLFLLAMIPAMIAQYRYSMTYFILNDVTGIGPLEAIQHSTQMMNGSKWKLFCLQWRFFGWALLCILTLGIGFLWLTPYMMTSMGAFYDDLKKGQT